MEDFDLISAGQYDPVWYDRELFRVVDASIDPTWKKRRGTTYSFPEFIDDKNFYNEVLGGEEAAVDVFTSYVRKYKRPH